MDKAAIPNFKVGMMKQYKFGENSLWDSVLAKPWHRSHIFEFSWKENQLLCLSYLWNGHSTFYYLIFLNGIFPFYLFPLIWTIHLFPFTCSHLAVPIQLIPFTCSHSPDPIQLFPFTCSVATDPIHLLPFSWFNWFQELFSLNIHQ